MTKEEAKQIELEIWGYLKDHPECRYMPQLPKELWDKVKDFDNHSPVCDYIFKQCTKLQNDSNACTTCDGLHCCDDCPHDSCGKDQLFDLWQEGKTAEIRMKAANEIYNKVLEW